MLYSVDVVESYQGDGFEGSEIPEMTPETWHYILKLGLQILAVGAVLAYFRKVYLKQFPFRISPLSILVGVIGVVLWIAVCYPQIESGTFGLLPDWVRPDLSRPSFNPYLIQDRFALVLFLVVRFSVLTITVPLLEELLVRGWLVRWVQNPDFQSVSFKGLTTMALLSASIYGVLVHPLEAIAAFIWFGLVTWLMVKTENLWDCVVAHAVTNFLLGVYILWSHQWHLW